MLVKRVGLGDVALVELEKKNDHRGYFARSFCLEEFQSAGIRFPIAQCNVSQNERRGTLRGLHFQTDPFGEAKIVSCHRGAIFDVAVDIDPGSSTYLKWFGVELNQENSLMLYIPKGFAHGYLTLVDDSLVSYMVSTPYEPNAGTGYRWDDPAIGIKWPCTGDVLLSEKDAAWPLLDGRI